MAWAFSIGGLWACAGVAIAVYVIYDFLVQECDEADFNGTCMHSPKDWCNGSSRVIDGLRNRFVHEKEDALELLQE